MSENSCGEQGAQTLQWPYSTSRQVTNSFKSAIHDWANPRLDEWGMKFSDRFVGAPDRRVADEALTIA
jgi:hypothetical protein